MPYSIVTVCCARDRAKMLLQARSIDRFVPAELVNQVVVILNGDVGEWMAGPNSVLYPTEGWYWLNELRAAYGTRRPDVIFVRAAELLSASDARVDGWWSQQVLKLAAAGVVKNGRYVILDAKNHLTGPLTLDKLENGRGVPRTGCQDYRQHNMGEFTRASLAFFGVDPAAHMGFFLQTVTPFVAYTSWARATLQAVTERWRARGGRADMGLAGIFAHARITEFMSYGAVIVAAGLRLEDFYDPHQPGCATLWASEVGRLPDYLAHASFAFGIHTEAWPLLDYRQREMIAAFWLERGLVVSFGEGMELLRECGARAKP